MFTRCYQGSADQILMMELVHRHAEENQHVIDLPYRLCSWSFHEPCNTRLWFDDSGTLRAWAVFQLPFWTIDYAFDPPTDHALHGQVLDWAMERAQQLLNDPDNPRDTWYVNVFDRQKERMAALAARGIVDQMNAPVDPWSMVLLTRPAAASPQRKALPLGYRVRALNGQEEVAAYVALHQAVFQSKNMSEEWRSQVIRHPAYRPDLDLVIEAPDTSLAAFCIGWFDPGGYGGRPCGQIEPLGVCEQHRHPGLAKFLLKECFHRLQEMGAEQIYVQTDNYRDEALALYTSSGFYLEQEIHVFRKDL